MIYVFSFAYSEPRLILPHKIFYVGPRVAESIKKILKVITLFTDIECLSKVKVIVIKADREDKKLSQKAQQKIDEQIQEILSQRSFL